ncbi:hypothetical protein [Prauserella flavalba]|uniref:hypothetical protein n=1 Tax=Prauserella flavalba TaxID=1477506 RepID=UPI0036E6467C
MATIRGGKLIEGSGLDAPLLTEATPVADTTYLGTAVVGSLLIDTANGVLYICTATNGTSTVTWTAVGAQGGV